MKPVIAYFTLYYGAWFVFEQYDAMAAFAWIIIWLCAWILLEEDWPARKPKDKP